MSQLPQRRRRVFTGWSGGVTGSENPKTFTLRSDLTARANFKEVPPTCSSPRPQRPAEAQRTVTLSATAPVWMVSGGVARKQQTLTKRDDTNPFKWSGPTACEWIDDWKLGVTYPETKTLETKRKPDDLRFRLPPLTSTETRWVQRFVPPLFDCASFEERRSVLKTTTHTITYAWSGSSWESTIKMTTVTSYRRWTRTGATRACQSGVGGQSAAGLSAGVHLLEWGTQLIEFTVPEGATVTLGGRRLADGNGTSVFTVTGGAELVVTATTASGVGGQAAPEHSTLAAIAGSLRAVSPASPDAAVTTERECALADLPESGSARIDLDADPCVVAPVGSYLIVKVADGAELSRQLAEGGAALGALFDAMLPSPATEESSSSPAS